VTDDAVYLPPGHVGVSNKPGSEMVQSSPSEELKAIEAVIMKNMQATRGG
jgi:hypothetical protein